MHNLERIAKDHLVNRYGLIAISKFNLDQALAKSKIFKEFYKTPPHGFRDENGEKFYHGFQVEDILERLLSKAAEKSVIEKLFNRTKK